MPYADSRPRSLSGFLALPALLTLAVLACFPLAAAAQEGISGTAADERSATDTGFDTPEFSPQQRATMALNSGRRNLESAREVTAKAAAEDNAKKREKLEKRAHKAYERAASDFRTVTQVDPRHPEALAGLASALHQMESYEDALKAYNQSLAVAPENEASLYGRAEVFLGLDRPREAAASYTLLQPLAPEKAEELLAALKDWTERRRADPAGIDPELLEALEQWVAEKEGGGVQEGGMATEAEGQVEGGAG